MTYPTATSPLRQDWKLLLLQLENLVLKHAVADRDRRLATAYQEREDLLEMFVPPWRA